MKKTKLKEQLKWAFSLTRGYRSKLVLCLLLEVTTVVFSLSFVLLSKYAVDTAVKGGEHLSLILVGVVLSIILGMVFRSLAQWINENVRIQMVQQLQFNVAELQMRSAWQVVKKWHSGDIQVRVHSDCVEVVQMISVYSVSFFATLIRLLASFGFLWYMDPMLAMIIVVISPLFLFSKVYFRKMRRLNRRIKEEESNFGKVLQENMRFRVLIRAMNVFNRRLEAMDHTQKELKGLRLEQLTFSTFSQLLMKISVNIGYLVTFIWGVFRLQSGAISFGTMTAFLQLVGRIQSPIMSLAGYVPAFIRFRTACERLIELEEQESEAIEDGLVISDILALKAKGLSFRYEDFWVLDNINLQVERGRPVAVVGTSGKGKTTLIRLFLALINPNQGEIYIQTPVEKILVGSEHRKNFAYVPQGNSLFNGTVKENLEVAIEGSDMELMDRALKIACAEFVYDLPDGLDTFIGESGYGLSEGQAQRIAIARALMQDRPIWLFDEITSALDEETSLKLMENLIYASKDKISLFVTHDRNIAEMCNEIIYVN